MKRQSLPLIAAFGFLATIAFADDKFEVPEDLPLEFPNFRLTDLDGNVHRFSDWSDAKAIVVFLQGNGCPIVRQSFPYLMQVRDEFEPKGVKFVMINSNTHDDIPSIKQELIDYNVDILTLKDPLQAVVRNLGSERTAEAFLIDPNTRTIIYRGEADDRFGYGLQRSNPQAFYLIDALNGWLDDGAMPEDRIRITKGCLMDLAELPAEVDFENDVVPILRNLCSVDEHDDHTACIAAWNINQAELHSTTLWELLLLQQMPEIACTPNSPAIISNDDALTLMGWLTHHQPKHYVDEPAA